MPWMRSIWPCGKQGDTEDEGFFDNPEVELRTQHIG
jgi:hypothetical protein